MFMYGNNFKKDIDKSNYRVPTVMTRFDLLREKLMRKKRGVGVACRAGCRADLRQLDNGQAACVSAIFHMNFGDRQLSHI